MTSPRKTRSSSSRGRTASDSGTNNGSVLMSYTTNVPDTFSSRIPSSAIPKPPVHGSQSRSLVPIRPASTRPPFRPTVRQPSDAYPPASSCASTGDPLRKPQLGLKPPTSVKSMQNSRGPSYTLRLKDTAMLRQEIQPKTALIAGTSETSGTSSDSADEDEGNDPVASTSRLYPHASNTSMASSLRISSPSSSPYPQHVLPSSDDRPSSSASASTALSDIETDVAASASSSPHLSDSATSGGSSSLAERQSETAGDSTCATSRTTRQRSRTPVFFGTPSKDEHEQRRRYSRRVRERRVLRRDSLDLARRKTLTLEEVEDAVRAYREEKAATSETQQTGGSKQNSGARLSPEAPRSPFLQTLSQAEQVESQLNRPLLEEQHHPGSQQPEEELSLAVSLSEDDVASANRPRHVGAADIDRAALVADIVGRPCSLPELPDSGEIGGEKALPQEKGHATETSAPTLAQGQLEIAGMSEETSPLLRFGEGVTEAEATHDVVGVLEQPLEPLEPLRDITNIPNNRAVETEQADHQTQAHSVQEVPPSVTVSSEPTQDQERQQETVYLLGTPLMSRSSPSDVQGAEVRLESESDINSAEVAGLKSLCSHTTDFLYIPDVMDQTLAFERLEEEEEQVEVEGGQTGEAKMKEPDTSTEDDDALEVKPWKVDLNGGQEMEQLLGPTSGLTELCDTEAASDEGVSLAYLSDVSKAASGAAQGQERHLLEAGELPNMGILSHECVEYDAAARCEVTSMQVGQIIDSTTAGPVEGKVDQVKVSGHAQVEPEGALTTEVTITKMTADEKFDQSLTLPCSEAGLQHISAGEPEKASVAPEAVSEQTQPHTGTAVQVPIVVDCAEHAESGLTPTSPALLLQIPVTPAKAEDESPSTSFVIDSPGVGLSFRRRYDENVLASAARRIQAGFGPCQKAFPASPADDSLRSLKASPMPLSLHGTPLGERNANVVLIHRESEQSPAAESSEAQKYHESPFPSPSRSHSPIEKQFSPQMLRLMDARDALLRDSPSKSPRRPAARVAVACPHKAEATVLSTGPGKTTTSLAQRTKDRFPKAMSREFEEEENLASLSPSTVPSGPSASAPLVFKKPEMSTPENDDASASPPTSPQLGPSSLAATSRLPKAALSVSRIAKPTPLGSIRAPTAVPASRSHNTSYVSANSGQTRGPAPLGTSVSNLDPSKSLQKKSGTKISAVSSISRPSSAADSVNSTSSSVDGSCKGKVLKDQRLAARNPSSPVKAEASTAPSPPKRANPISALRKVQGTNQLSSFGHKTADWLKGSANEASGQWVIGRSALPTAAPIRSVPQSSSTAASREGESETATIGPFLPAKPKAMTGGSGRARRVLAGSKEATQAPVEIKAAPINRPRIFMSSTSSQRTDSDMDGNTQSEAKSSSSPEKLGRGLRDDAAVSEAVDRGPMLAAYRKPSTAVHGIKGVRSGSNSSNGGRKASRTGDLAPLSNGTSTREADRSTSTNCVPSSPGAPKVKLCGTDLVSHLPRSEESRHGSLADLGLIAPARGISSAKTISNPTASASASAPRASRTKVADVVPSVPISSAALASLTTRNSRRNEVHLAKLSVVTIRMEGARPPSPSSKIRKSSLAEGAPPMEKGRADEARAVRARKRARESMESRGSSAEGEVPTGTTMANQGNSERDGVGIWRDSNFQGWQTEMAHHRLGAGDEELFATPPRVRKRAATAAAAGVVGMKTSGVRWKKNLFSGPASSTSTSTTSSSLSASLMGCLVAKDYRLDRHGNARSGDAPPSPSWRRVRVTIRKIVYDDDDDEDEEEDMQGEEGGTMAAHSVEDCATSEGDD